MTHHEHTKIKDVMTLDPRAVESFATVAEAAKLMRDGDVGPVPIVDDGSVTGLLTDRDIVVRVVADGKDPSSTTVGEVASRDLVTIDPDQTLDEALRLMARHRIRRLPVCEDDGRLVGIVAQRDIALEADEATTGELVEEISKN